MLTRLHRSDTKSAKVLDFSKCIFVQLLSETKNKTLNPKTADVLAAQAVPTCKSSLLVDEKRTSKTVDRDLLSAICRLTSVRKHS